MPQKYSLAKISKSHLSPLLFSLYMNPTSALSPVATPVKRKGSTSTPASKIKSGSPTLKRAGSSAGKRVVKRNASTPPVRGSSRDPSVGPSEADNDELSSEMDSSQAPQAEEEKEKVAEDDVGEESEEETKELGVDDFDMRMMIQSELDRRKEDMRYAYHSFYDTLEVHANSNVI
jgi:hypothetical protein